MKYDDASWHYGGDYPKDLPDEASATHTGMFLAWCLLNNLAGELHLEEFPDELKSLSQKEVTPGAWFLKYCDGKFTDEDLNDIGNSFAQDYFDFEKGQYLEDYENSVGIGLETLYHVPDTWDTYSNLEPLILSKFNQWKESKS